jgi:carboxyl-terminal processing protease
MPRRNLTVIAIVLIVAFLCYAKAPTNRYNRILAESMEIVERNSLEKVEDRKLFEGAMNGMMSALEDDYSYYMPPAEQNELNKDLDAKFTGIGVEITLDPKTREIFVHSPIYNSPAYKAGVLAGDKLLRINGQSTQGMSLKDATEVLHGKIGEKVTLAVLHKGEEKPSEVEIVRAEIHVDTVLGDTRDAKGAWNYFLPGTDKIAYLRLNNFAVNTAAELESALQKLTDEKMRGLILDLRDNPGGLLPTACDVCDLFLKKGKKKDKVIVSTRGRDGEIREEYFATGNGRFTDIPMVVLVNQSSASASEIVAACLQDHHRAAIVGQRTFGKGTVQHVIDLEKDCGAIRLTTAGYWRPSGKNIHRKHGASESDQWGVMPDPDCQIIVNGDDLTKLRLWRLRRDTQPEAFEDYRTADLQLNKAVECLQKMTAQKRGEK